MTTIEWTQNPDGTKGKTWNPIRGCNRVSDGCTNCYAMRQAHRFSGAGKPYEGLTTIRRGKVDWTGVARFIPGELDAPLRWRKPQRIFVNSMSDLFHHSLTNEEIAAVFGVMAACPQHTFQVLTKRPERAAQWFQWLLNHCSSEDGTRPPAVLGYFARTKGATIDGTYTLNGAGALLRDVAWPIPNVWLGVSVEDQKTADERIPLLLSCPAAVRFISAEPLLGPLEVSEYLRGSRTLHVSLDIKGALRNGGNSLDGFMADGRPLSRDAARQELRSALESGKRVLPMGECDGFSDQTGCPGHDHAKLDWVIVGGESGHGARPFDVEWARSVVEQCASAGVACFVKQLGARPFDGRWTLRGHSHPTEPNWLSLCDSKGGDWSEWPDDLRVRQFPEVRT